MAILGRIGAGDSIFTLDFQELTIMLGLYREGTKARC
jgi:hypothetical protein